MNSEPRGASDPPAEATPAAPEAAVAAVVWRVVDFIGGSPVEHSPTATFVDDLEFDSMTVVTLYAICEELFEVDLFDSDSVAGQVAVGDLIAHLAERLGAGTGQMPDDAAIDDLLAQYA